jgi:Phosphotransferase enzyme family
VTSPSLSPGDLALLAGALGRLSGGGREPVRVVSATVLGEGVHRLELSRADRPCVVVKRLRSHRARLEQRVTGRWLPGVGLDGLGPPRLSTVAETDGTYVWHVYDDLGAHDLDRPDLDAGAVDLTMCRLADLHARFAGHLLLPEVRFAAGDLGVYFYTRSVRDALATVDRMRPPRLVPCPEDATTRDGVLARLQTLRDDEPARVRLLEGAGPETLVHGDLTRENVFVLDGAVRLIDWDHVGVAPAAFDLSTHVTHYPPAQRPLVVDRYTAAMAERGFPFREDLDWDLLVRTFEAGRLANQLIWLATGVLEGTEKTFDRLVEWGQALAAAVDGTVSVVSGAAP